MSNSSDLALAYLRNLQWVRQNGQEDHASLLLEKALEWLDRADREERMNVLPTLPVRFEVGVGLHAGNTRPRNEDYTFAEQAVRVSPSGEYEPVGVFALADGMGGQADGREAAALAVHAFADSAFLSLMEGDVETSALGSALRDYMCEANYEVCLRNDDPLRTRPMGTTLTVAIAVGKQLAISSIGDSRAYLYRPSSGLRQMTRDHSLVAQLVEDGEITPEEVYTHSQRNLIYRSLGQWDIEIDEPIRLGLQNGDILLLCSDGLWEMVRDPEVKAIQDVLSRPDTDAPEMAGMLVELALSGGGLDNIGVLVVKVTEGASGLL